MASAATSLRQSPKTPIFEAKSLESISEELLKQREESLNPKEEADRIYALGMYEKGCGLFTSTEHYFIQMLF